MEQGVIHIISEIGGCVIDLPVDSEGIAKSLHNYAGRHGMESMELLDPEATNLGEWAGMAGYAMARYRIEGPVLVGQHDGERVLVGVNKRYGYPGPGVSLEPTYKVVTFSS